ncbi:hypothetical protein [Agriterribacter sp.]|uniref:hypothetical protein n=1 Tax=Agriterribacter sp. TaxID=2821509 RepID=UPI002CF4ED7F|nr:hypothetical protein [Agriterribacter sp.]HTN06551.1 hypothetical protein [Agriterribacter sp.]
MQTSILILFLILTGLTVLVFVYVFTTSKGKIFSAEGIRNALKKRFWFILILFVLLGFSAWVTISKSPYYFFADEVPSHVIHVASMQFAFILSNNSIDPDSPKGVSSIALPKNELIEFRVTSLDVNHGFAIYNASGRLIAQTQAMPGYVNRLRWKFTEPGIYHILCLEYCGMAHHGMRASITIK